MHYPLQKQSMQLLIGFMHHRQTRRYFIRHSLVGANDKLFHFLHVRCIDPSVLKEYVPSGWWPGKTPHDQKHEDACTRAQLEIAGEVKELKNMQVVFFKLLLKNDDGTETSPSSRALFLKNLRSYIRDVRIALKVI